MIKPGVIVVTSGAVCLLCAVGLSLVRLKLSPIPPAVSLIEILSLPLASGLVFCGFGFCFPSLASVGQIRFPITLTLPIVFCSLVKLMTELWNSEFNVLVRLPHLTYIVQFWSPVQNIGVLILVQFVVLTGIGLLKRRPTSTPVQE